MKIIFKNAQLLDFKKDSLRNVDILVYDDLIEKIGTKIDEKVDDVVDLGGNIVLPPFSNCFYRSVNALKNSYFEEDKTFDANEKEFARKYMWQKNILSGAVYFYDFSFETPFSFVENVEKKEEKELEKIAFSLKDKLFLKVGQTLEEMGEINSRSKKMPSEFLEDFGFLDKDAVIVGGNLFEKDELEIFSSYNSTFVLLPNDDARSGRRFANLNSLRKFGIPFGIGSGDFAEIDFFGFMRQILSYNSFVMENTSLLSPKEILEIATLGGAKILGYDGEIREGNFANFILLSYKNILSNDIYKGIVFELSKQDVLKTVKNGKILQENGVFVMENEPIYDKIFLRSNLK